MARLSRVYKDCHVVETVDAWCCWLVTGKSAYETSLSRSDAFLLTATIANKSVCPPESCCLSFSLSTPTSTFPRD
ncbi:hypothetical protein E2C01_039822 [Portunus trituberculatus]|uniref:Uncharacterized protein n=1 Tax=Portunus trituberculatus TaxID=210409 RepID=A0A5B7FLY3_PORTR|nr:hypothetical protein [Portunus trituberculatus]